MSLNNHAIYKTFIASASITALTLVKLDSDAKVTPCTASTDIPVGVAQIAGASGDAINVCVFGVSRVVAGGTITLPLVFSVVLPSTFCTRLPATSIVKAVIVSTFMKSVLQQFFKICKSWRTLQELKFSCRSQVYKTKYHMQSGTRESSFWKQNKLSILKKKSSHAKWQS